MPREDLDELSELLLRVDVPSRLTVCVRPVSSVVFTVVRVVPFDLTRVSTVVVFGSREDVVLAERVVVLLDVRFVFVVLDVRFVVLLGLVVVVERLVVVVVVLVLALERFVVVVLVVLVPRVVVCEAERELCSR